MIKQILRSSQVKLGALTLLKGARLYTLHRLHAQPGTMDSHYFSY